MARWLVFLASSLGLGLGLGGCGKSEAVVAYEELAAAVCKCTDEACAREVGDRFEARLARYGKEGVQAKDGEAINKIAEQITACAARLVASAPRPGPSQDGEAAGKPGKSKTDKADKAAADKADKAAADRADKAAEKATLNASDTAAEKAAEAREPTPPEPPVPPATP